MASFCVIEAKDAKDGRIEVALARKGSSQLDVPVIYCTGISSAIPSRKDERRLRRTPAFGARTCACGRASMPWRFG